MRIYTKFEWHESKGNRFWKSSCKLQLGRRDELYPIGQSLTLPVSRRSNYFEACLSGVARNPSPSPRARMVDVGAVFTGELAVCGRMLRQWYNRMILGAPGPFPVCKLATYNYHTSRLQLPLQCFGERCTDAPPDRRFKPNFSRSWRGETRSSGFDELCQPR